MSRSVFIPGETYLGECLYDTVGGTGNGCWAFIKRHDGVLYEGFRELRNGDRLIIFDPEYRDLVIWEGIVNLKTFPNFTERVFGRFWINAEQKGADRKLWAQWFFNGYPATLTIPL